MRTDKLFVVIVLYKQNIQDCLSFISLIEAIRYYNPFRITLYVYDNSPTPYISNIDNIVGINNIIYYHDSTNPGVSKAYNSAAKVAKMDDAEWLLLLDQDTILPKDILFEYFQAISKHPQNNLFVPLIFAEHNIISPYRVSCKVGWRIRNEVIGYISSKKYHAINSALFVRVKYFLALNGYDEKIKLDFTDFVFFDKYSAFADSFFVIKAKCKQNLSTYETDVDKLMRRYISFCTDALHCPRKNRIDSLSYFFVVFKRTLSLVIQTRSLKFLKLLWKTYFSSKI